MNGFSLIEVILAAALFIIFAVAEVSVVVQGLEANRQGVEQTAATQYAAEGLEAVRSIGNQGYSLLTDSAGEGLAQVSGVWAFTGASNTFDKYTRVLSVSDVYRDSNGNIVSSGGTFDPNTKKVISTVAWNIAGVRTDSVNLSTYITNWRNKINGRGGMLAYQDGGTSTDLVRYKLLDGATQTWGSIRTMPTVSSGGDRLLRVGKLYSSTTRNEKILLSRRFDGTSQYIYAQIWNGTAWTNQLLSSWNSTSFLDVQNFDGTYLSNGNFMAVYSNNTSSPKYQVWNGLSWGAQSSLVDLANNGSGIPLWIVAKARPGSNEVMAAFLGQLKDTNTEYWSGTGWTLHPRHSSAAAASNEDLIDFSWSKSNPLQGALVYSDKTNDKSLQIKIWTANGSGGGSWSSAVKGPNLTTLGPDRLANFVSSNNYLACDQDSSRDIKCFTSSSSPKWSTPVNNTLTATTDNGTQRAFDAGFESLSGDGLAVFSDSTSILKYKKFTPSSNVFDAAPNSLSQSASGPIKTVSIIPSPATDDMMILFADSNNHLYSVVWNGSANSMYTMPSGFSINSQGSNGVSTGSYWYDFAWDGM